MKRNRSSWSSSTPGVMMRHGFRQCAVAVETGLKEMPPFLTTWFFFMRRSSRRTVGTKKILQGIFKINLINFCIFILYYFRPIHPDRYCLFSKYEYAASDHSLFTMNKRTAEKLQQMHFDLLASENIPKPHIIWVIFFPYHLKFHYSLFFIP